MVRDVKRSHAVAALAAMCAVAAGTTARGGDYSSDVILARVQPSVVLIWKTNGAIADLSAQDQVGSRLYDDFIAVGVRIMQAHVPKDASGTITLNLLYATDATDNRYKIETLSGLDRMGSLSASAADLEKSGTQWVRQLSNGAIPQRLHVTIDPAWRDRLNAR